MRADWAQHRGTGTSDWTGAPSAGFVSPGHRLFCVCLQGLEGEDEGAISMLSDNTAKLTSAVRY